VSGASGTSGSSGTSGTSGVNGAPGSSGSSGTSGANGAPGSSGSSGTSGANGANGANGTSGSSGTSGTSGNTGANGTSGTSGAGTLSGGTADRIAVFSGATTLTAYANLRWDSTNSRLGIGGAPSYPLHVNGEIYGTDNITAYSDERAKKNIVTIEDALKKVLQLRGVYFDWKDKDKRGTGVIAQETLRVLPEVVSYAPDIDQYSVAYGNIVGLLIEAIKEQQKQIDELKKKIGTE
jgi:hypothetical protein